MKIPIATNILKNEKIYVNGDHIFVKSRIETSLKTDFNSN